MQTNTNLKILTSKAEIDNSVYNFFEILDKEFVPAISKRTTIEKYIESIFENCGQLILYEKENHICGILGLVTNHPIWKNYIQYVAVKTSERNKGISKMLLGKADEIFFTSGANSVTIRTWSSNKISNKVFTQFGFIHTITVLDDRETGIHSHVYMKSLTDYQFKNKILSLGIIGGMGTYSTSAFIQTISNIPRQVLEEQKLLSYILINDSTIPDRTTNILNQKHEVVIIHLKTNIEKLKKLEISHAIILCFTIQPYLDNLKKDETIEHIDLLEFTSNLLKRKEGKWFLAATLGTYKTKPFSDSKIFYPNEDDQNKVHKIIYSIKSGINTEYYKQQLIDLAKQNRCTGILLGCTDLHKMYSHNLYQENIEIIDPLLELSLKIHSEKNETTFS